MNKSEQTADLFKAIVDAQVELKNPNKNRTVNVGKYSYKYAELSNIIDETKPVLMKHGLAVIQGSKPSEAGIIISTMLVHTTGQWIESELQIAYSSQGRMNTAQEMGSAITYGRRYALSSILNISADEDDDAQNLPKPTPTTPHPTTPPAKTYTQPNQGSGLMASDKQVGLIHMLLEKSGIDKTVVYKKFGVESSKQMNMAQASECITKLNEYIAKKEAHNAPSPIEPPPTAGNEVVDVDEIAEALGMNEGGETL
jgi:hypothetical protein